jgi:carbamoyl-phosphate synthase large subunit
VDTLLGPEMRSTGEVMGIHADWGRAFAKAQDGGGQALPARGGIFLSVSDRDKPALAEPARRLAGLGFELYATTGTAAFLRGLGLAATEVAKIGEGRPDVVELVTGGKVDLVVNTPRGRGPRADGYQIRAAAVAHGVPCITTASGAAAAARGIEALIKGPIEVRPLQDYHRLIGSNGRAEAGA